MHVDGTAYKCKPGMSAIAGISKGYSYLMSYFFNILFKPVKKHSQGLTRRKSTTDEALLQLRL
ncbi:hypothetical protein LY76DRAFT_590404 [Colletotrichum caudatum]|nr:hypothetical protein LY76DRAFT_590404 [Colletotrichum caudatum]